VSVVVALSGEEAAGARVLRLLIDRGHRPPFVFTDADPSPAGAASVASLAVREGIAVRPATEVSDPATASLLNTAGVELLLNVHSLHIIDQAVLEAPRLGTYNLHPGPLPERAGLNVPSWAVYAGASEHGVTVHRVVAAIDQGPIAYEERFPLERDATGLTVSAECAKRGIRLIEKLLERVGAGQPIPSRKQDLSRHRWFDAGPPQRGVVDWEHPAEAVCAFVRACDYGPFPSPWGYPRCWSGADEIGILSASATASLANQPPGTVDRGPEGAVLVASADRWVEVSAIELGGDRLAAHERLNPGAILTGPQNDVTAACG
jgi:methionyl-tRNA formyltransferase